MTSLSLTLDSELVQKVVRAQLAPLVEQELAKLDISALIQEALKINQTKEPLSMKDMLGLSWGAHHSLPKSLLESAVDTFLRDEVKTFVRLKLAEQRPFFHQAFTKMMANSERKLINSFAKAIEGKLEDPDFEFSLLVEMKDSSDE